MLPHLNTEAVVDAVFSDLDGNEDKSITVSEFLHNIHHLKHGTLPSNVSVTSKTFLSFVRLLDMVLMLYH